MTNSNYATALNRRNLFKSFIVPALAVVVVAGATAAPAEARSSPIGKASLQAKLPVAKMVIPMVTRVPICSLTSTS